MRTLTPVFVHAVLFVLLLAHVSYGQDCLLTIPANPLTAAGLSTPYVVSSSDPAVSCKQADVGSFVQGAILDLQTGALYVYNPLIIDAGSTAAVPPVVPNLPANYVAALWFGTNGNSLTLVGTGNSLSDGQCINGSPGSIFGQVSYCNSPAFFYAAYYMVSIGKLIVPQLGTALDGQSCPTTHSFFVVDQDETDNVVTSYLIAPNGRSAQNTAINRKKYPNATVITNGSDERLLTLMNTGLGCSDFRAPDLADPGQLVPSVAGNEISANFRQQRPVALVPSTDPMVLLGSGATSLQKVNLYRIGFGQPLITTINQANPTVYCQNMANVFPTRMLNRKTKALLSAQPSPDPAMATNLYLFLAQRFVTSYQMLNCSGLLGFPVCMKIAAAAGVALDVVIDAKLIPPPTAEASAGTQVHPPHFVLIALIPLVVTWALHSV